MKKMSVVSGVFMILSLHVGMGAAVASAIPRDTACFPEESALYDCEVETEQNEQVTMEELTLNGVNSTFAYSGTGPLGSGPCACGNKGKPGHARFGAKRLQFFCLDESGGAMLAAHFANRRRMRLHAQFFDLLVTNVTTHLGSSVLKCRKAPEPE